MGTETNGKTAIYWKLVEILDAATVVTWGLGSGYRREGTLQVTRDAKTGRWVGGRMAAGARKNGMYTESRVSQVHPVFGAGSPSFG